MEWYAIALIAYPLYLIHEIWIKPYLPTEPPPPIYTPTFKKTEPPARATTELPPSVTAEWERPKKSKDYIDYKEYVASDEWQKSERRLNCIKAARNKCQMCGAMFGLEVHHITYTNLGAELPQELVLLCVLCHEHTHAMAGKGAKSYPPIRRPDINAPDSIFKKE